MLNLSLAKRNAVSDLCVSDRGRYITWSKLGGNWKALQRTQLPAWPVSGPMLSREPARNGTAPAITRTCGICGVMAGCPLAVWVGGPTRHIAKGSAPDSESPVPTAASACAGSRADSGSSRGGASSCDEEQRRRRGGGAQLSDGSSASSSPRLPSPRSRPAPHDSTQVRRPAQAHGSRVGTAPALPIGDASSPGSKFLSTRMPTRIQCFRVLGSSRPSLDAPRSASVRTSSDSIESTL
jgi:hypothetical protein